jgi:hypothetical protein
MTFVADYTLWDGNCLFIACANGLCARFPHAAVTNLGMEIVFSSPMPMDFDGRFPAGTNDTPWDGNCLFIAYAHRLRWRIPRWRQLHTLGR